MYCIYDSGLYMAQACARLCHQRRHGGNGESGEYYNTNKVQSNLAIRGLAANWMF